LLHIITNINITTLLFSFLSLSITSFIFRPYFHYFSLNNIAIVIFVFAYYCHFILHFHMPELILLILPLFIRHIIVTLSFVWLFFMPINYWFHYFSSFFTLVFNIIGFTPLLIRHWLLNIIAFRHWFSSLLLLLVIMLTYYIIDIRHAIVFFFLHFHHYYYCLLVITI
jgi:hypothetical protein